MKLNDSLHKHLQYVYSKMLISWNFSGEQLTFMQSVTRNSFKIIFCCRISFQVNRYDVLASGGIVSVLFESGKTRRFATKRCIRNKTLITDQMEGKN